MRKIKNNLNYLIQLFFGLIIIFYFIYIRVIVTRLPRELNIVVINENSLTINYFLIFIILSGLFSSITLIIMCIQNIYNIEPSKFKQLIYIYVGKGYEYLIECLIKITEYIIFRPIIYEKLEDLGVKYINILSRNKHIEFLIPIGWLRPNKGLLFNIPIIWYKILIWLRFLISFLILISFFIDVFYFYRLNYFYKFLILLSIPLILDFIEFIFTRVIAVNSKDYIQEQFEIDLHYSDGTISPLFVKKNGINVLVEEETLPYNLYENNREIVGVNIRIVYEGELKITDAQNNIVNNEAAVKRCSTIYMAYIKFIALKNLYMEYKSKREFHFLLLVQIGYFIGWSYILINNYFQFMV